MSTGHRVRDIGRGSQGPLLDRFDLIVRVGRVEAGEYAGPAGEPSAEVAPRVLGPRAAQVGPGTPQPSPCAGSAYQETAAAKALGARQPSAAASSRPVAGTGCAGWRGPSPISPEWTRSRKSTWRRRSGSAASGGMTEPSRLGPGRRRLSRRASSTWRSLRPLSSSGRRAAAPAVAVVGTRKCTRYGLSLAESFGAALARAGWTTVSGLARGIDAAAHRGTLAAGGEAVAVLGSGVDVVYPQENRVIYDQIVAGQGAVISEYPPGTRPDRWRFPARNRLIAAISSAVVVVEAGAKGGALITARLAAEIGRPVFAVPGDVDRPASVGCNLLIRDGAIPSSWRRGPDRRARIDARCPDPSRQGRLAIPGDRVGHRRSPREVGLHPAEALARRGPDGGRGADPEDGRFDAASDLTPSSRKLGNNIARVQIPEMPAWASDPVDSFLTRMVRTARPLAQHGGRLSPRPDPVLRLLRSRRGRIGSTLSGGSTPGAIWHFSTRWGYSRRSMTRKASAVRSFYNDAGTTRDRGDQPVRGRGPTQAGPPPSPCAARPGR